MRIGSALRRLAAVAVLPGLYGCAGAASDAHPTTIRFATGLPGMTFKPLGEALADAYKSVLPDVHFQMLQTAGSVSNIQHLQAGDADVALALADVAYTAYNGRGAIFPEPAQNIRGIAVLHPSTVHVLVPAGSRVQSVGDIRGRVGVGPLGSGTAVTSAILLGAFAVPQDRIENRPLPFIDDAAALADGSLDAAIIVAADPVDVVRRATQTGARLVDVSGQTVQRLRADYPFLRPGVIPGGTYPGEPEPIRTMLVDVLLLCRDGLDEQLVRRLTSGLFQVLPAVAPTNDFLRVIDMNRAPATPIPLHTGAALYYREQELLR